MVDLSLHWWCNEGGNIVIMVIGQPTPVLHSHHEEINQVVTEKRKKPKLISPLDFMIPVLPFGSPLLFFILIPPVQKSGSGIETIILLSL